MTMITTPSAVDANSFVDLTFANAYFTTKFGADNWDTFDNPTKEKLLVSGTEAISVFRFGGTKTIRAQALEWPRKWLSYEDGLLIPDTEIPLNLKKAVCEMAYWIWTEEDRLMSDVEITQIESMKVGPLDVKVSASANIIPLQVEALLRAIGPDVLISTGSGAKVTRIFR